MVLFYRYTARKLPGKTVLVPNLHTERRCSGKLACGDVRVFPANLVSRDRLWNVQVAPYRWDGRLDDRLDGASGSDSGPPSFRWISHRRCSARVHARHDVRE